jgi:hypothetical protein
MAGPAALRREGWRDEQPVLCLAGRGALDPSAALIAAQLLAKHGLGTRVTPYTAASSVKANALDLEGVAAICICSVSVTGRPAYLRYALRRLKGRRPNALTIAGFWPDEEMVTVDRTIRTAIGADLCVSSLRDLVAACVEAAGSEAPADGTSSAPAVPSAPSPAAVTG